MTDHRPLSPVRDVVEGLMHRYDLQEKKESNLIAVLWDEIVGERVAHVSRPGECRDGVLFVKVKSPQWAQELTYMKTQVLSNLREQLPSLRVEDIRFTAAWTSPGDFVEEVVEETSTWPRDAELRQVVLSEADRRTIETLAEVVSEMELRDRLRRVLENEFKSRRWRLDNGWRECPRCQALFFGSRENCDFCHAEQGRR